jgi:hypothetical protein
MDEQAPPSRWAFSWLEGLLIYDTALDHGQAAWETWILTHPDLRLKTARDIIGTSAGDDLVQEMAGMDEDPSEHELWEPFIPRMMASLRALLPEGLDRELKYTALDVDIPEGLDRQTVVFVPGDAARVPPWLAVGESLGFGITAERHSPGWRVVGVQREWTYPQWMADARA